MNTIDLHTHTTFSDGTFTPIQLVDYARVKKLSALAITDHDTISGISEARMHLGDDSSLEIISGIEFSTNSDTFNCDIHILGLFIDENDVVFAEKLRSIIESRNARNQKMVDKLCEIGLPITMKDVIRNSTDGVITRAHFGKALLEKGYIHKMKEAFSKYIGNDCIAYVPREKLTPQMAIEMIKACGGVAVLAHPTLYNLDLRELDALIKELVTGGLQGIEGLYSLYTVSEIRYLNDFAVKYGLVITGGSDFHGNNKTGIDLGVGRGQLQIPYSLLEPIRSLSQKINPPGV